MPKLLFLDIEATNLKPDFGYTICVATKELGKPARVMTVADYGLHTQEPWNDRMLLQDVKETLLGADAFVTYYGKGFDIPFLNGRFVWNKLAPLPEIIPHIDLYFIVRRVLAASSRSMGNVAELVRAENRKMYAPHEWWVKAQAGHIPSIRALAKRCKSDVEVLENTYEVLRPNIRLHPNLGRDDLGACRFCGMARLQRRGYQLTQTKKKARVQCTNCGAWDTRRYVEEAS